jgi:hypothetical protein
MKNSRIIIIYLGIFFLLPLLAFVPLLPKTTINGIPPAGRFPALTLSKLQSGVFQKQVESWVMKHGTLWGVLVQVSNQINYSVFSHVTNDYNPPVLVGKNGQLFQPMYLQSYNRSKIVKQVNEKFFQKKIQLLEELQKKLHQRGTQLIVVVSPNVVSLYPELIPDSYLDPTRNFRKGSYEMFKPLLVKSSLVNADLFEFFKREKEHLPLKIFENTGSHWNNYASCLAAKEVVTKLNRDRMTNEKLRKRAQLPSVLCDSPVKTFPPPTAERDLVEIANLAFESSLYQPSLVVPPPQRNRSPSTALAVGTSFLFGLTARLDEQKIFNSGQLYFYYRQVRNFEDTKFNTLNKQKINWNEVLNKDVIILEVNQSGPGQIGFGFVRDALKYLKKK